MVEENIDLRDMTPTSYVPGDRITGSLDKLGCVVIRGIRIEKETYDAINVISETSIEEFNSKRVMKYKTGSTPHIHWANEINCVKFLEDTY